MAGSSGDDVLVLLMPEVAVDIAALQQFLVPSDIVHAPLLENQNGIRRHKRRRASKSGT